MIRLTSLAEKELYSLPKSIRCRVNGLLDRLENWPAVSGVKPLRGRLAGHYRLRTGDFRVQFRVAGADLVIEHMGHRDKFYD